MFSSLPLSVIPSSLILLEPESFAELPVLLWPQRFRQHVSSHLVGGAILQLDLLLLAQLLDVPLFRVDVIRSSAYSFRTHKLQASLVDDCRIVLPLVEVTEKLSELRTHSPSKTASRRVDLRTGTTSRTSIFGSRYLRPILRQRNRLVPVSTELQLIVFRSLQIPQHSFRIGPVGNLRRGYNTLLNH